MPHSTRPNIAVLLSLVIYLAALPTVVLGESPNSTDSPSQLPVVPSLAPSPGPPYGSWAQKNKCVHTTFPYSAGEFVKKLMRVADGSDADLEAVRTKVAAVFHLESLRDVRRAGDPRPWYAPKHPCDWYAYLAVYLIPSRDPPTDTSTAVEIGDTQTILSFNTISPISCLTGELLDRELKADSWTGAVDPSSSYYQYSRRTVVLIISTLSIWNDPNQQRCVSRVFVSFVPPNQERR
jgi:hypothetical protein